MVFYMSPSGRQSRKKQKPTPETDSNSLAPSSYHQKFQNLNEQRQWLLKQIQRKKSELQNFLNQAHNIRSEMLRRGANIHEQWRNLDEELHQFFEEILSSEDMGDWESKEVQKWYRRLQLSGLISPRMSRQELIQTFVQEKFPFLDDETAEAMQQMYEQQFEETSSGDRDRTHHFSAEDFSSENDEFQESQSPANSRQIRQTFLRLAEVFHPDKVTDDEVQKHYSEIMKEVNSAYQQRDLARLLELERKYEAGEKITVESSSESEVKRQCEQLEKDNLLLQAQYENLKAEVRQIRNSEEGQIVTEYRRAQRQRWDFISQLLEEEKMQVNTLEEFRNLVGRLRDRKIGVKKFLRELQTL
jgi:hypothetical protein